MPREGHVWRHVVIGTLGSWLPGSPKGWRARDHKTHSSGDYRTPPPSGEHAGLYKYSKQISPAAVSLDAEHRLALGIALRESFEKQDCLILAVAVCSHHAHLLVELPIDLAEARRIVGNAKKYASRQVKSTLPGRVWAAGGKYKRIDNAAYQRRVFAYILKHQDQGAWVWSYRDQAE